MKAAKLFWSTGSIIINIIIGIYIYLQSGGPTTRPERYEYINANWHLYGGHWKAEFLIMTLIGISTLYFAIHFKSITWSVITIGQFIILLTYPLMLGGYRNTPPEIAELANQLATITFIFGNLIFFAGLFFLYLKTDLLKPWQQYLGMIISGFATILFLIIYVDIITWVQALVAAPVINTLYLLNAYYGFKLKEQS